MLPRRAYPSAQGRFGFSLVEFPSSTTMLSCLPLRTLGVPWRRAGHGPTTSPCQSVPIYRAPILRPAPCPHGHRGVPLETAIRSMFAPQAARWHWAEPRDEGLAGCPCLGGGRAGCARVLRAHHPRWRWQLTAICADPAQRRPPAVASALPSGFSGRAVVSAPGWFCAALLSGPHCVTAEGLRQWQWASQRVGAARVLSSSRIWLTGSGGLGCSARHGGARPHAFPGCASTPSKTPKRRPKPSRNRTSLDQNSPTSANFVPVSTNFDRVWADRISPEFAKHWPKLGPRSPTLA